MSAGADLPPDTLPAGVRLVRTTPVFDHDDVPVGLLGEHRVASGVWGRLVVRSGRLRFVFDGEQPSSRVVTAGDQVVIPPQRPHHVELVGAVAFVVEFHR